ncbi:hypothetical protein MNBD_CPR01-522 [hydrothermal vent metagenome]|uniref:Uncharacterized protein n=1 Tax=hydrothermal vent metagenome TaxID=652676 RepID=A0A3B0UQ48_9ZZZZ
MNVPSQIPTSFVPHETLPTSSVPKHTRADLHGAFSFLVYGALALVVSASIGMFVYERVLSGQVVAQHAKIATAEKSINAGTIKQFIHLRDQLSSVHTLLDNHITLSRFFNVLESTTVHDVSFSSLKIGLKDGVDGSKSIMLTGNGRARDFNTLSAEAKSLDGSGAFSGAQFSGISVNKDNSVNFTVNAVVLPSVSKNFSAVIASTATKDVVNAVQSATTTASKHQSLTPQTP